MHNEELSCGELRVEHVSDTALMVAAGRALETARADGVIRDPFAARLAGARGEALVRKLLAPDWVGIGMGLRCRTVDETLVEAIAAHGIRTVVTLGAGLDTRPWRLDLPPQLRWIEVDFAPILQYKARILASERPKCRVEMMAADLRVSSERQAVFAAAGSAPGLIVAEGLLLYLPARVTEALATEPPRLSGIRFWLLDVAARALMRNAHPGTLEEIEKLRAQDRVEGRPILDLVQRNGWNLIARRPYAEEGFAIAAARGLSIAADEEVGDDASGIYLFGRPTASPSP